MGWLRPGSSGVGILSPWPVVPHLALILPLGVISTWVAGKRFRIAAYFMPLLVSYIGLSFFLFLAAPPFVDHLPGLLLSAVLLIPLQALTAKLEVPALKCGLLIGVLIAVVSASELGSGYLKQWEVEWARDKSGRVIRNAQARVDSILLPEHRVEVHFDPTKTSSRQILSFSGRSRKLDVIVTCYPNGEQRLHIGTLNGDLRDCFREGAIANGRFNDLRIEENRLSARTEDESLWLMGGPRMDD